MAMATPVNVWINLLNKAEVLVKAGRVGEAVQTLASDPNLYNRIATGVIQALQSYPGGAVADLNGNIWPTHALVSRVRRGDWSAPPLTNFLLAEIQEVRASLR